MFKNLSAAKKQELEEQRRAGNAPKFLDRGKPVPWHRVARARNTRSLVTQRQRQPCLMKPPHDYEACILGSTSEVWRQSTRRYAGASPMTFTYYHEQTLYDELMHLMTRVCASGVELCTRVLAPNKEMMLLRQAMKGLVQKHQPMVLDLLKFLVCTKPRNSMTERLKESIFQLISQTPAESEGEPLYVLFQNLKDREFLTRMIVPMTKCKLNAMWNTPPPGQIEASQRGRLFFRRVFADGISVLLEYNELNDVELRIRQLQPLDQCGTFGTLVDSNRVTGTSEAELHVPEPATIFAANATLSSYPNIEILSLSGRD